MQEELFLLLRLGLGTSSPEQENLSLLSSLKEEQWEELESISQKQGIAAIVFDGISAVVDYKGTQFLNQFKNKSFWSGFIACWGVGVVEQQYVLGNKKQYEVIKDLQNRWSGSGIRMLLMKGMAMGTYYPIPYHRCPGDIDCYLFEDYVKGNELARLWADRVDDGWYKHSQIQYKGQLIENHQYFVHTREGKSSKQLNELLCETLTDVQFNILSGTGVLLPPPMFNALFLTYHSCSHFLGEGLRLKQIVDWAMFLRNDCDMIDWPLFYSLCEKFHFRRFAEVVTDIAVHCLGVQISSSQIITDSPYTEKVIESTLFDDDYVFDNFKGKWTTRLLVVKNLFKYRWKYYQIYQYGIFRQLWYYFTGLVFKTE